MEGNLRFKIDRASLIVGRNSAVFALFYFVKLTTISTYKTPGGGGGLYLERRFNGGFFAVRVWGAYTWRGLFSQFCGISNILLTCQLKA